MGSTTSCVGGVVLLAGGAGVAKLTLGKKKVTAAGKKVLVTGATGLLGRPTVTELHKRGMTVTSLSSKELGSIAKETQDILKNANADHFQLDLAADMANNCAKLREKLKEGKFDLIINLAADRGGASPEGKGGTERKMNNPGLNADMPLSVATVAQELKIPMIHLSTEYVWSGARNTPAGYPAVVVGTDDRFVGAGAPYAQQKRQSEEKLKDFKNVTILRIPVLYGDMLVALEDGTAGSSIKNYLTENSWAHDTWQKRYPTYAADVAFILGALSAKLLAKGLDNPVYHYGAQKSISKNEFVRLIAEVLASRKVVTLEQAYQRIKATDASTNPPEKRPPEDVKLDSSETKKELGSDWKEPSTLDAEMVKRIFTKHFEKEMAECEQGMTPKIIQCQPYLRDN